VSSGFAHAPPLPRAKRVGTALVVASLFFVPFVFYWRLFVWEPSERTLFRGDFLNQHYVWKSYALGRIANGELPLWNPHLLGGAPLHANPQVGLFYPPNYLLLPFVRDGRINYLALEAFQLLHQGLAGVGMWLLLRSFGLSLLGSAAGALIAMFTGFFTTPGHHALVLTAGWIPLVLYQVKQASSVPGARSIALAALAMAMMVLAGHPQPAYYGLVLSAAWSIYCGGWRGAFRRFLPAAGLAAALAAVQLLPTYELARDTYRVGAGYDYSTTFDFSSFFLAGLVAPRGQVPLSGQDVSTPLHAYVGIGALLLAATGLACSRRRERWFFAAAAVTSLLLALGSDSFLFDIGYLALPGFRRFRMAFRLLGVYALSLAVLAALGLDSLSARERVSRARITLITRVGFGIWLLLTGWAAYLHTSLLTSPGALAAGEIERMVSAANWAVLLLALNLLVLVGVLWRARRYAGPALLAILAVDLGSFVKNRGQHPYTSLVRTEAREVSELLKAQGFRARYVTDTNLESYASFHGTEFAGGHDSLIDSRYQALLAESAGSANVLSLLNVKFVDRATPVGEIRWCGPRFKPPLPLLDVAPAIAPLTLEVLPARQTRQLKVFWDPLGKEVEAAIEIEGKKYALEGGFPLVVEFREPIRLARLTIQLGRASAGIRIQDLELDGESAAEVSDFLRLGPNLYLNLHSLPRAYVVSRCTAGDEEPALELLACWSPERGAVLSTCAQSRSPTGLQPVSITRYEPEEVVLEARLGESGYLVLSDTWRPGWRAELDGSQVPLLRAQLAFRAVAVPAGTHTLRFRYRPLSFYLGLGVSALAGVALVTALFKLRRREEPRSRPVV